jgi:hypothetical protein
MNTAWISAFSPVMGSPVAGSTSFVTTYANQRAQYRRDFLSKQLAQRENLYSEFISEAARLQIDSLFVSRFPRTYAQDRTGFPSPMTATRNNEEPLFGKSEVVDYARAVERLAVNRSQFAAGGWSLFRALGQQSGEA